MKLIVAAVTEKLIKKLKRLNVISSSLKYKKYIFLAICLIGLLILVSKINRTANDLKKLYSMKIDKPLSDWKKDEIIAANLPSLPYIAWKRNKESRWNLQCGQYPFIYDVSFYNTYWQTLKVDTYSLQIFGAYYDNRPIFGSKSFVRIYAMINGFMPNITTHCQLWFDSDREPVVAKVFEIQYAWSREWGVDKTGGYEPHFLTCEIPTSHSHMIPTSVTLVEKECDKGDNHLTVMNERPASIAEKTEFGVCVRNAVFPFEDMSVRYIEWIELQLALGASQIYFYVMDLHPNIAKVFDHYEKLGKVRVSYMTFPSGSPNIHGLPQEFQKVNGKTVKWETISLNDCYYRNMHKHEYLAMLDPDEVLMPKMHFKDWHEMLETVVNDNSLNRAKVNSFNFRQSYFLDSTNQTRRENVPEFMYMLQHLERAEEFSKEGMYIKSFHNTANCLVMHNHFPMYCVAAQNWCNNYYVDTKYGQMNHYREDCHRWNYTCDVNIDVKVVDNNIQKFEDRLVETTKKTMSILGLL